MFQSAGLIGIISWAREVSYKVRANRQSDTPRILVGRGLQIVSRGCSM